jgi:ABC-type spermidine/putrescine transport system permease subunit I
VITLDLNKDKDMFIDIKHYRRLLNRNNESYHIYSYVSSLVIPVGVCLIIGVPIYYYFNRDNE